MLIIGIIGGIGSGKSTACEFFKQKGASIISLDDIAHSLLKKGQPTLKKILPIFSENLLKPTGELNRSKLARIIFNDPFKKKQLEDCLHPAIIDRMHQELARIQAPYCLIEIPLFVKTNINWPVNRVLLVHCRKEQQINRIKKRDNRSDELIDQIIEQQATNKQRHALAHDVLDNSETIDALKDAVDHWDHFYREKAKLL